MDEQWIHESLKIITTKVNEWISLLELLSKTAAIEGKSAYCVLIASFKHKVTYTMRTIPDICQNLQKLDIMFKRLSYQLLLLPNSIERKLLSLPVKL